MKNRIKDEARHTQFIEMLGNTPADVSPLIGLTNQARRSALAAQLVDSVRRIGYLNRIAARSKSASLYTPYSGAFEPLGGGAAFLRAGKVDDACWLVYLATHFGKHKQDGWNLTEDFYGRFGQGGVWDWASVSADPEEIEAWVAASYPVLTSAGRSRRFSNHRKFETLKSGPKGTGRALRSYVEWIGAYGSHSEMFSAIQQRVGQNPEDAFALLYRELSRVSKLGRLGKFDLLCNWSNLMIAPVFPDKAYIVGSTGPRIGAELLFGKLASKELESACTALSKHLKVSPQAIEDSLCNWQKSPNVYVYYNG